jgi:TolB protein
MRYARPVITAATLVAAVACHGPAPRPAAPVSEPAAVHGPATEPHLSNIRQLTHGGENAEAYFSTDGKRLIFQSTRDGRSCDQEYLMNADGSAQQRISDGTGKTTCGYFFAYNTKVFYSSTRAADTACPGKPDPSKGYVWGLDKYDIYTANADGSGTQRLTRNGVYTAEGTLSPDGKTIVFTSLKDGDLDIYTMNVDGSNVQRLTSTPGYDGGPFFSPDGKRIVYRAYHPTDSTELAQYRQLLSQSIVRPNKMEIWVMNADGSDQHQITHLGGANFAPFFTPDGTHIIFSSNYSKPHSGEFDLYLVDDNGGSLEPVTNAKGFDGFPQFSPDGKQLVWASSRNATGEHQLDLFMADWKP